MEPVNNSTILVGNSEGLLKKRPLPSFIKKLWFILADKPSQEYIFWVDNGQVICVPNATSFSKHILPKYFKHNNWQSFVRQLNLYGFRKVYQLNLSYEESTEKRTVWQFKHEYFRKDCPEKLCEIKRRTSKATSSTNSFITNQASTSTQTTTDMIPSNINDNNIGILQPQLALLHINTTATSNQQTGSPSTSQHYNDLPLLTHLSNRLEDVDRKRKELWKLTMQLSEKQIRQQKAIRILTEYIIQILNKLPDSDTDRLRFSTIMNEMMDQDLSPVQSVNEFSPYNSDNNMTSMPSATSSASSSHPHHHFPPPQSTSQSTPQQQQPPLAGDQLPSISALIGDHPHSILPPLRKRRRE